jgi:hypothetical protein
MIPSQMEKNMRWVITFESFDDDAGNDGRFVGE